MTTIHDSRPVEPIVTDWDTAYSGAVYALNESRNEQSSRPEKIKKWILILALFFITSVLGNLALRDYMEPSGSAINLASVEMCYELHQSFSTEAMEYIYTFDRGCEAREIKQ